jgi:hypothetical protein
MVAGLNFGLASMTDALSGACGDSHSLVCINANKIVFSSACDDVYD